MRGLAGDARCPECGSPVAASDPALRRPSDFAALMSVRTLLHTAVQAVTRPHGFYRTLDLSGSNLPPRLYLLVFALCVGVTIGTGLVLTGVVEPVLTWAYAMLAVKATILLTYIETLGVAFFSRQRGWRVPMLSVERVCCYAAPGWLVAALAALFLIVLHEQGVPQALLARIPFADQSIVLPAFYAALAGIAMFCFEALVYVGVRQVRFANRA